MKTTLADTLAASCLRDKQLPTSTVLASWHCPGHNRYAFVWYSYTTVLQICHVHSLLLFPAAPPTLNICNAGCSCSGPNNDKCYNPFVIVDGVNSFQVTANYTGNGPFTVWWFHNDSKDPLVCDGLVHDGLSCEKHTSQYDSTVRVQL